MLEIDVSGSPWIKALVDEGVEARTKAFALRVIEGIAGKRGLSLMGAQRAVLESLDSETLVSVVARISTCEDGQAAFDESISSR